jgi:hypothetical protein
MIENIHQRPILISKREGGIFSQKRSQGEHATGSPGLARHADKAAAASMHPEASGQTLKPGRTFRPKNSRGEQNQLVLRGVLDLSGAERESNRLLGGIKRLDRLQRLPLLHSR